MNEHQSAFVGCWTVQEATLPTGAPAYTGTIRIDQTEVTLLLEWDITDGRYVGVGMLHDNHLFVSCGEQFAGLGLAFYQPRGDGNVDVWWCAGEHASQIGSGRFTMPWQGSFVGNIRSNIISLMDAPMARGHYKQSERGRCMRYDGSKMVKSTFAGLAWTHLVALSLAGIQIHSNWPF